MQFASFLAIKQRLLTSSSALLKFTSLQVACLTRYGVTTKIKTSLDVLIYSGHKKTLVGQMRTCRKSVELIRACSRRLLMSLIHGQRGSNWHKEKLKLLLHKTI